MKRFLILINILKMIVCEVIKLLWFFKKKRYNNFLKRVHLEHMDITVNRIVLLFAMKIHVTMSTDHVFAKMGRMEITVIIVSDTLSVVEVYFCIMFSKQSKVIRFYEA